MPGKPGVTLYRRNPDHIDATMNQAGKCVLKSQCILARYFYERK